MTLKLFSTVAAAEQLKSNFSPRTHVVWKQRVMKGSLCNPQPTPAKHFLDQRRPLREGPQLPIDRNNSRKHGSESPDFDF